MAGFIENNGYIQVFTPITPSLLLMETSDRLLLETNDGILLE